MDEPHPTGVRAGPRLSPVAGSAAIRPYADLPARRPSTPLKRLVRRALRWYLWPVADRISAHNHAVDAVLAENARQLAWVEMEAERVTRDVDLAERNLPR